MTLLLTIPARPVLFDRPPGSGHHGIWWTLGWLRSRDEPKSGMPRPKRATARRVRSSVFVFNILPFRPKTTLDLDSLYRQHASMVARRVRQFVRQDDVEEVVHEIFLKAYERRASFRGESSPVTWLYHIATNHCLNRIRNQKRRQESLELNKDLPWLHPSDGAGAEEILLLEQLWSHLDDEQSMIAMYYFIDGLTHAEIARITNVSRRTIGNRIDEITTLMRSRMEGRR